MSKKQEPIGLIFILNKKDGDIDIEEKLKPYFSLIIKNLVSEKYITTQEEFNKIFEGEMVHFIRLEDVDFQKLSENEELIGGTALDVYKTYHGVQASEDVKAIFYEGKKAPWGFDLYICVVYSY
ncbi:MAG: hypothetical protein ACTSRZ_15885 [Promethearchaeota archaeon]